jgi:peptide deformylase
MEKRETSSYSPVAPLAEGPQVTRSGVFARTASPGVLTRPDPRLGAPSEAVDPHAPEVGLLARALVARMRGAAGRFALAAPQIGAMVRLVAVDVTGHAEARSCAGLLVLANPRVVARRGNAVREESCTSVPDLTAEVARAAEIVVEALEPGTGRRIRVHADAAEARCLLHAIDHLDGYLFVERALEASPASSSRTWYV